MLTQNLAGKVFSPGPQLGGSGALPGQVLRGLGRINFVCNYLTFFPGALGACHSKRRVRGALAFEPTPPSGNPQAHDGEGF